MDTTEFSESRYVTVELVSNSPTKRLVILNSGEKVANEEGRVRLDLNVEIDGKRKVWRPNKQSIQNLQARFGVDSDFWLAKEINLTIVPIMGRLAIVGIPKSIGFIQQSNIPTSN